MCGVAMTERPDELEQMTTLTKKLTHERRAAAGDRHDRGRCAQEAALEIYPGRAIVNSVSLEGGRGEKMERDDAAGGALRCRDGGDDDRRGRHGPHGRAQAGGRQAHRPDRPGRVWRAARGADLRRADLPDHDRPGRAAPRCDRNAGRHPAGQTADPGLLHDAGRVQPELRRGAARARRAELGVFVPCRAMPAWTRRSSIRRM